MNIGKNTLCKDNHASTLQHTQNTQSTLCTHSKHTQRSPAHRILRKWCENVKVDFHDLLWSSVVFHTVSWCFRVFHGTSRQVKADYGRPWQTKADDARSWSRWYNADDANADESGWKQLLKDTFWVSHSCTRSSFGFLWMCSKLLPGNCPILFCYTKVWEEGGSCACHASREGVQPAHPIQVLFLKIDEKTRKLSGAVSLTGRPMAALLSSRAEMQNPQKAQIDANVCSRWQKKMMCQNCQNIFQVWSSLHSKAQSHCSATLLFQSLSRMKSRNFILQRLASTWEYQIILVLYFFIFLYFCILVFL